MAMIDRRKKNNKKYKRQAAKRIGPQGIVLQFIQDIDKLKGEAKGPVDFELGLTMHANTLLSRMRAIDPSVDLEIKWCDEYRVNNWQDLVVEGVLIKWSSFYLGKNPFSDPEKYIDVGSLFLEGYMTEDEPVHKDEVPT